VLEYRYETAKTTKRRADGVERDKPVVAQLATAFPYEDETTLSEDALLPKQHQSTRAPMTLFMLFGLRPRDEIPSSAASILKPVFVRGRSLASRPMNVRVCE
jgi:hypothetical protein